MRYLFIVMMLALGGVGSVSQANAASSGYTTAGTNLRTGPGYDYGRLDYMPAGRTVSIHVCTWDGQWCDISSRYRRGWINARYLYRYTYRRPYRPPFYAWPPYWSFDFRYDDHDWYPHRPYRHPRRKPRRRH